MQSFTLHADCMYIHDTKAKIYSRLDYIKKATENYTLEGTPADLTGVLQQVEVVVVCALPLRCAY